MRWTFKTASRNLRGHMTEAIPILAGTAALIGLGHTLAGPDHYLPFIVMGKARKWSMPKTMWITFLCGLGHVLGSILLGLIGAALGIALSKLEWFEAWRGNLAAQLLMIFGFTYCVWGIHRAIKNRPHSHAHVHENGTLHTHKHTHSMEHAHPHEQKVRPITPWILFTIFVLGPCEPLIPLIMYPAAEHSWWGMLLVASIFAVATISTMMGVVLAASWGIRLVPIGTFERYTHALAGAAICLSGMAIQFLGL
ncbi:sulfite exporter TauE/SafE family protein [Pontiella agarivorans]|uniref:Sulfite exporter TauE/SafE family protein n=1 Tax=Pontiella agarivorans TaxID=3038953 RepID=A0ABU5MWN8_9BACT|nr:sulfite exporter TauE/SafE family protein [Pontiella agarivorans]MDZ8118610.1 sulfite exporter TauE/SafE family protein [Pontiella agarivorans]